MSQETELQQVAIANPRLAVLVPRGGASAVPLALLLCLWAAACEDASPTPMTATELSGMAGTGESKIAAGVGAGGAGLATLQDEPRAGSTVVGGPAAGTGSAVSEQPLAQADWCEVKSVLKTHCGTCHGERPVFVAPM